jgi:hypothetical protein
VHKLDGDPLHDRGMSRVRAKDLVESGVGALRRHEEVKTVSGYP